MKKKVIFLTVSIMLVICLVGCTSNGEVYICTGPKSRVYHKTDDCTGLSRCSGSIKKITIEEAKTRNRRPCKWCY